MADGVEDTAEQIRKLGAEIAGHDQSSVKPRPRRSPPPRWLVVVRYFALVAFAGQMIYAGAVRHDGRGFVIGLVGLLGAVFILLR